MTLVRALIVVMLGLTAVLVVAGCAAAGQVAASSPGPQPAAVDRARGDAMGGAELASAAPEGAGGVEVVWWIADDSDGAVAEALSTASEVESAFPGFHAHWSDNGFRLLRTSPDVLASLLGSAPPEGRLNRKWLGWSPRWSDVFRGRRLGGTAPVLVNGARVTLPTGTGRLIARTWASPGGVHNLRLPDRGEIRFELVMQLQQPQRVDAAGIMLDPRITPDEAQGYVVEGLSLDVRLEPGVVYLITAERPGVDWRDESVAAATSDEELGPPSSPIPSLGEAMLTRRADDDGGRPLKAVIAIIPHAATFRLLPEPGA